jgi:hypothetical protein
LQEILFPSKSFAGVMLRRFGRCVQLFAAVILGIVLPRPQGQVLAADRPLDTMGKFVS